MKRYIGVLFLCLIATTAFASDGPGIESPMTHRMMMLVLQLGTILFAAKLSGILFERLRMPGVLGEMAAGILIGPYVLGGVPLPGLPEGLFAVAGDFPVSAELYGFCSVAAIVLLFVVGLETDVKLFLRYSLAGSLVGVGGAVTSFVVGDLTAVLFSPMLFAEPVGFMSPSALFLGVISTATSVGISARVLSERRKLDSPEGVTILAGAVIDDVLGIIMLAVAMGIISASKMSGAIDWEHIGLISLKAVGIWLTATVVGIVAAHHISLLLKLFRDRASIAVMALGLALILAGLFEEAGLAMIVGAYVMGLSLSGTDINQVIREKLHPISAFLVPIFFAVMGMLVDVRLLASQHVLLFGLIYTAGAILAKILGCGLPTLFCNFNTRGALRVGFGMLPRGEVALIIAGIGLSAGILSKEVFGVGILMTLVTTLMAPPVLVWLFNNPTSGLRKPIVDASQELLFQFPSEETASLLVAKLLSAFDSEGFFTHALSRTGRLYQLRKRDVIINFKQVENEIIFECEQSEAGFVNTAMYEVLAELEQAVKELKKPVDRHAIGRRLQEDVSATTTTSSGGATLAAHLDPSLLEPQLKGTTKSEIIDELLDLIHGRGLLADIDAAREAIWTREESMSTGMQYGVALPHGRTDVVRSIACAVGVNREGVDFDSMDGQPSRIFVLLLSPKSAVNPHIHLLSRVSQVLDEKGRSAILACTTNQEMYRVFVEHPGGRRKTDPDS